MRFAALLLLLGSPLALWTTGCSGADALRDETLAILAAADSSATDSTAIDWGGIDAEGDSLGLGLSGGGVGGGGSGEGGQGIGTIFTTGRGSGSGGFGRGNAVLGDVTIQGTSILGAWKAVEVIGEARDTRALEAGTATVTLIISPNGRATINGSNPGDGTFTRNGRITDNRLTIAGVEGSSLLLLNGPRLVVREPDGRSTAFVRASD